MHNDIPKYFLSEMTRLWTRPDGEPRLAMDEITGRRLCDDWPSLAAHISDGLRFPRPQASKVQSYGWTATLFQPSEKAIACADGRVWHKAGTWRSGEHEIDVTSVWYGDVDNARADTPAVSMAGAAASLARFGFAYLLYPTFSHTPSLPKFRVVIPLAELAERRDLRLATLYLNQALLGGQADQSIYDPSDFVFGPCHAGQALLGAGQPLQIADAADYVDAEGLASDLAVQAWIEGKAEAAETAVQPSPEQAAAIARRMDTWTVKTGLSIANPALCHPHWLGDYGAPGRSHNDDIGSIMSKVWKRSGGSLTLGEMADLYDQVDALAGHYCARKYGEARKLDRVRRIMRGITAEPVMVRAAPEPPPRPVPVRPPENDSLARLRRRAGFFS